MAVDSDWQEYIRRQLEEEQRHLEILQQQLLHEQAMLLVSHIQLHFSPFYHLKKNLNELNAVSTFMPQVILMFLQLPGC